VDLKYHKFSFSDGEAIADLIITVLSASLSIRPPSIYYILSRWQDLCFNYSRFPGSAQSAPFQTHFRTFYFVI
jgi:hypothetical protein